MCVYVCVCVRACAYVCVVCMSFMLTLNCFMHFMDGILICVWVSCLLIDCKVFALFVWLV